MYLILYLNLLSNEIFAPRELAKLHKARPLAVERRLDEMHSPLNEAGPPVCGIQF
jgi:hypothetical protein